MEYERKTIKITSINHTRANFSLLLDFTIISSFVAHEILFLNTLEMVSFFSEHFS